jgi:hypothetical protein
MRANIAALLVALALPAWAGKKDAPALAGTWSGGGLVLVLNADGTGTLQDGEYAPKEPLRWRASGTKLTLIEDGEEIAFAFRLEGATLHLSGGDLDEPVALKRAGAAGTGTTAAAPPSRSAAPKAGDCKTTCRHYLKCAGQPGPAEQEECVQACTLAGYDGEFLGWFQSLACPAALAVVAVLDAQQRGFEEPAGGQAAQGGQQSSECEGCRWDGSECNWYSQSNWGSNVAYSGAVISCNSSCCGR